MSGKNLTGRELIVLAKPEAGLRAMRENVASVTSHDVSSLADLLTKEGATLQPLFGASEEKIQFDARAFTAASGIELPDLSTYYRVQAPDERLDALAKRLRSMDIVEAAYVKPAAELAQKINELLPKPEEAPPSTPDFTSRQKYLDPAPVGIDARYAWTQPGGGGQNVRIIDIEGAWRFTHEDLLKNQGGVVGGVQSSSEVWRNHGTAVVGEFGGDQNTFGVTGISPDANVRAISIFGGIGSSGAIRKAADMLEPGDIILIELHYPGPRYNFQQRGDQKGYIAVEWWPDEFDAIKYATSKGIIVVEAAGNGAENLDDALYNKPATGFPAGWTNPFNRNNRDSGAILVGAGNPPAGTHGRSVQPIFNEQYVDRARCGFSNYGALIDAQGWGWEVTSCGYGDLQGGSSEDVWYTDQFSGTSSASPIIVGALACVQGILRSKGVKPMNPAQARKCLRNTGSTQADAPNRPASHRIGNRPNIRQLIICALGGKDIKEGKENKKEFKDIKEKEKDIKDLKDGRKEFKDTKEKEKDFKDLKDGRKEIWEKTRDVVISAAGEAGTLEARLGRIEDAIFELAHFIGVDLRPDLTESSLSREPDLQTLSWDLQKQASDAKNAKDAKDIEKCNDI